MYITFLNIILSILTLIVLPICIGNTICCILKQDISSAKCFITGSITMWAVCQLVAVPLILLKQSFILVVGILSLVYAGLVIYGLCNKNSRNGYKKILLNAREIIPVVQNDVKKSEKILNVIAFFIMCLAVVLIVFASIFLQHTDADDSRFVVNAVDIYRTNRMLLTDVNSGNAISSFLGDLNKDVTSPWAVFTAYISKITGTYPSIMMHTILPPVIMLILGAVYWILSEHFFGKDVFHRSMFVCFAILLNIYGYYSVYTSETFVLIRMWQGKAVLAGVGIPVMLWRFLELYKDDKKGNYLLLLIADFAMCLLSNMGIILCGIMLGCYGFVYGIARKNWKMMVLLWLMCVVNVIYIGISYLM
ncbi:MAG: hypothetical protein IJV15_10645 [Lachnospiraceae bacterium]|nr:hypothetical protein [Lachnospiraceae bacterium]